jgi:general secretion pathway protein F
VLYKYRAKKGPQEVTEGYLEAQTEKEAIEKVSQMGYLPLHLQVQGQEEKGPGSIPGRGEHFGRVKSKEITVFSRQLSSLLKSGVPILRAINIISEQSQNPNLRALLENIHRQVKDGGTFSGSLAKFGRAFSPLYIAMIRTGEDSGNLPDVLLRIADYRSKQEEMLSRLRMALAYPALMALVGTGTIIFMFAFVIPRLTGIFTNMGQSLPLPTRMLIAISRVIRESWVWIAVVAVMAVVIVRRQLQTRVGRISFSVFMLRLPIFGKFTLKAELARFARTLEVLIKSGIPILKAIDIAIPVLDNEIIKEQLGQSYKELEQGGSFGRSLKKSKILPVFMSDLIIVGEESGKLDEALHEVANAYERDTDEEVRIMSSLLEPLLILGMGLIVGFIVMAMLLPIFEINLMIK